MKRTEGKGVLIFNRMVREGLWEKVANEQRLEGSERMNHVARWRGRFQAAETAGTRASMRNSQLDRVT